MFMSENHIHVLHFLGIQIPPNDYPYINSRKEETRAHECSLHYVEWPPWINGSNNAKTMAPWILWLTKPCDCGCVDTGEHRCGLFCFPPWILWGSEKVPSLLQEIHVHHVIVWCSKRQDHAASACCFCVCFCWLNFNKLLCLCCA